MNTVAASQGIPIFLNLLAAVLGAAGQYLYKIGGNHLGTVPIYRNWHLFAGMLLFCVVMVLFVWAFKLGGRLSVVYPVYATTFVWGTLLAVGIDKEPFSGMQGLGVAAIVLGVSLIAWGAVK